MFGTIRRHQQWLWVFLIAAMSVSMVWFFTPTQDLGSGFRPQPSGEFGSIKGRPITREQANEAYKEIQLFFFMNNRRWPEADDLQDRQKEREIIYRAFMTQKTKDLGIHVSEKAVGLFMSQLIGDTPRERFETEILGPRGMQWGDFDRFARHQVAIQQMLGVVGLSGRLINAQEAEAILREDTEESHAQLAVFWASNYLDKVQVTPEEISKYYSNNLPAYRIPERLQVSYVAFPATNFFADADAELGKITNLTARIDEAYLRLGGTNQFKDDKGVPLPEAEAKRQIREQERLRLGLQSARRKAAEFGNTLADQPDPNALANFGKLGAANGLPVQVTPPFDRMKGLEDTNFPPAFVSEAFRLTTNEPIRFRAIVGENAVYLIAYNKRLPSESQSLDKVRDQVTAECKLAAAASLARKDGTNFANTTFTGLAQGKSFADLATQVKAPLITLPPISESSALTNVDVRLRLQEPEKPWMSREPRSTILFEMKPGQASRFVLTPDGGWVAYLKSRNPASPAQLQEEMPRFLANMRYYRSVEAFNKWLGRQMDLSQLVVPTNAPPPRATPPVSRPPTAPPKAAAPPVTQK